MKIETDIPAGFGSWKVEGSPQSIEFTTEFWADIANSVMADFLRLPYGGADVGGVLFGAREIDRVRILAYRPLECEHAYGPSFQLTENDEAGLRRLLDEVRTDPDLAGLQPVGWYHSKHQWLLLTPKDTAVYDRYFPEPWQLTLVFLRVRSASCMLGLFFRQEDGWVHCSHREFSVREARPEIAPAVAEEVKPPTAEPQLPALPEPPAAEPQLPTPPPVPPAPNPSHMQILANLLDGVRRRRGLMILTGERGTGKTTLLESFGDVLAQESIEFAFLLNSKVSVEEFYEFIAYDLDLRCGRPSKTNVLRALEVRTTVLIVDDAQDLDSEVLEEIRLFDNLQDRKGKLLQTILCGSPELDRRLEENDLRQLKQRVAMRCRLCGRSENQVD